VDSHTITVRRLAGTLRPASQPAAADAGPVVRSWPWRLVRRVGRLFLNLVFAAMIGCVGIMLVPAALGFHRYVILTGSMTGTYDRGSIVFDRPTPTSGLKVGDPITYSPPPGFTSQTRVTHRIWSIHRGANGVRVFKTKGDANAHPDIWNFTLNQPMQDEVVFHVPEVGYLFLMLSIRDFRIVLVGVPSLIIALIMLFGVWREAGDAARQQRIGEAGWRELSQSDGAIALPPLDGPAADPAPAWVNLHLRPRRAQRALLSPHRVSAQRSRVDLGAPLRVRRLLPLVEGGAKTVSLLGRDQTVPVHSPASIHLRVRRLSTSHRRPVIT
jgi:signal peptidase I